MLLQKVGIAVAAVLILVYPEIFARHHLVAARYEDVRLSVLSVVAEGYLCSHHSFTFSNCVFT